jgi:hypothetical protein
MHYITEWIDEYGQWIKKRAFSLCFKVRSTHCPGRNEETAANLCQTGSSCFQYLISKSCNHEAEVANNLDIRVHSSFPRSEIIKMVVINVALLCDETLCDLLDTYQHF